MQFYPHRTVEEQANRLPQELQEAYRNSQIDRITIFDGQQELEVTGYAEYSYLEEKSYKTQPVRTEDGSIAEIEQYATFLTPRLVIRYNMMAIEDYRSVMKMLKRRNGYIVKCYDVVEDKIVRNEMYVAPPSMPKLYQQYLSFLGVQDHTIEFIGTNVPIVGENATTTIFFNVSKLSSGAGNMSYSANFGMTWEDFVKSNPSAGFTIIGDNIYYSKSGIGGNITNPTTFNLINKDDYIISGFYYGY
jgi:hypothetical protein